MAAYDPKRIVDSSSTYDASQLAGKSVVVTGGCSGLGEEFVRKFVAAGAYVTIGDLAEDRGKHLVTELGGKDKAAFVRCDVTNWLDQLNLFKTAIASSPSQSLDIVVANAGIAGQDDIFGDTVGTDGEPVQPDLKILNVDLIGVMYTAKLALHYLPRQPEGPSRDRCLIMTASLAGYLDLPGAPQYNSAKWGVRGLMGCLRRTMPGQAMRVNIIAPWFVRTPIIPEPGQQWLESRGITFASASDAASAVLHLASDKTLNGRALAVVPRERNPRGYLDLQKDDYAEGELLFDLQNFAADGKGDHRM